MLLGRCEIEWLLWAGPEDLSMGRSKVLCVGPMLWAGPDLRCLMGLGSGSWGMLGRLGASSDGRSKVPWGAIPAEGGSPGPMRTRCLWDPGCLPSMFRLVGLSSLIGPVPLVEDEEGALLVLAPAIIGPSREVLPALRARIRAPSQPGEPGRAPEPAPGSGGGMG